MTICFMIMHSFTLLTAIIHCYSALNIKAQVIRVHCVCAGHFCLENEDHSFT